TVHAHHRAHNADKLELVGLEGHFQAIRQGIKVLRPIDERHRYSAVICALIFLAVVEADRSCISGRWYPVIVRIIQCDRDSAAIYTLLLLLFDGGRPIGIGLSSISKDSAYLLLRKIGKIEALLRPRLCGQRDKSTANGEANVANS